MPRPRLPPTPESSMDISGEDGTKHLQELQMSFELPPPGLASPPAEPRTRRFPQFVEYPAGQPSETVKSRRRSSAASSRKNDDKEKFELPPPPTRTRKIIHMKPKGQKDSSSAPKSSPSKEAASTASHPGASSSTTTTSATATNTTAATATTSGNGPASRRKQPSATSAAGKKMARKTAHSLIERRRRSKMNEEFALLKSMIPACTGDMHKLAILQASIEYLRYLEDCVAKLKARQSGESSLEGTTVLAPELDTHQNDTLVSHCDEVDMVDMAEADSDASTSTCTHSRRSSHQSSASPPLLPEDSALLRRESESSVATEGSRYSFSTASASVSASASPIFAAQLDRSNSYGRSPLPPISLMTASPLPEQRDAYQEATAALLMLNTERRESVTRAGSSPGDPSSKARGISVRDLLST